MYFQQHATTIGLIGCAGFMTAWGMEQALGFSMLAGAGALISGALVARLFGEAGAIGWMLAIFGAVMATMLGAASVGWIMMGVRGAAYGTQAVSELLWEDNLTTLRWLILMGLAHWVAHGEAKQKRNAGF